MRKNRILAILLVAVAMALVMAAGCSEKPTDYDGGGNIGLDVEVESSKLLAQASRVRLTVKGPNFDSIVAVTDVSNTGAFEFQVEVPAGPARLFILELFEPIPQAAQLERVIYRGANVADVRPDGRTRVPIRLIPMVPMVKLTPKSQTVPSGTQLSLDLKVYNMVGLTRAEFWIDFNSFTTGEYFEPILVGRPDWLPESFFFDTEINNNWDEDMYRIRFGDSSGLPLPFLAQEFTLLSIPFATEARADSAVRSVPLEFFFQERDLFVQGQPDIMGEVYWETADVRLTPLEDRVLAFPDSVLESELIWAIYLGDANEIRLRDALLLDRFSVIESGVTDLTGLDQVANLTYIGVGYGDSVIADLSPLAGLKKLKQLEIYREPVRDLRPLAGLLALERLTVSETPLVDISPLAGLHNLTVLNLQTNSISDLSALRHLPKLTNINLFNNQVSDLTPLVENLDLFGQAVTIDVRSNPLSDEALNVQIPALQSRFINVLYDAP